jgi:hypothetical protein
MAHALTWQNEERCVVGDTIFQTLPVDLLERDRPHISMKGADFLLFKERPLVDRYAQLLEDLRPRHIFELGIMEGGGTALLFELARPSRLVAVDQRAPLSSNLRDYVAGGGRDEAVRIYDHVDQGDRERLAEIVEEEFGDRALDLVVDDCSHQYEETSASFNELFPRLRPGGLYTIEDWPWAHDELLGRMWGDRVPLTRLVLELVLAAASAPDLISEITIEANSVQVWRGDAAMDPSGFEISSCLDATGRRLMAGDERVSESPGGPSS